MIKISTDNLNAGIELIRQIFSCNNPHNCLWMNKTKLFDGSLLQACPKKNCPVVIFRIRFEKNSPYYYDEALRLSRWDCVSLARTLDRRKVAEKKELEKRIYDLKFYEQLVALAIHPLDLAARGIPFLKPEEVGIIRRNWNLKEMQKVELALSQDNPAWLSWIEATAQKINLYPASRNYREAVLYLVYLFLKGLEKNQPPDLKKPGELEKLFSEIEGYLKIQG